MHTNLTDNEMMSRCLDAFEAIEGTDATRRKFLERELGIFPRRDASGAFLAKRIASNMAARVKRHLRVNP